MKGIFAVLFRAHRVLVVAVRDLGMELSGASWGPLLR